MSDIERTVRRFHERFAVDANHRYRSWGHCYRYFRRRSLLRGDRDLDQGALQLGFYLASWGMYRPSSFLLSKDYRIHRLAVRELLRPTYDSLLAFKPTSPKQGAEAIPRILALAEAIRRAYRNHAEAVNVTDTLVSKIMLGTLACIPAYDTNVIKGVRKAGLPFSRLNKRHLGALFDWYRDNQAQFLSLRSGIHEDGVRYPAMRLVDMYMWQRGQRA